MMMMMMVIMVVVMSIMAMMIMMMMMMDGLMTGAKRTGWAPNALDGRRMRKQPGRAPNG